jgi:UDP:flavonoid glycosyltransferase YjiC (YdhE family)
MGAEIMFSTYLDGVDLVKTRDFPVVSSPSLNLISDATGRIDLIATAVKNGFPALSKFMHQVTAEMEYMKAFKPNVVISDTRLSSIIAGKLLGFPVALVLNQFQPMFPRQKQAFNLSKVVDGGIMTLLGKGWAASDIILIPDFPEPYTICLDSLRIPKSYQNKVCMIGYILEKKPEELDEIERVKKEAFAGENHTIIYAAISGPDRERQPLINILKPIFEEFPDEYRVIMSLGNPLGGSIPKTSGVLTTIPWVRERWNYIKACGLVVCRGGHNTIMQSICYGKPPLIIPTPDHTEQYANARRAMELGFGDVIIQEELTREKLLMKIERVVKDPEYSLRLQELNSKGYFDGLDSIISIISKLMDS